MANHLDPAARIIDRFGGIKAVSKITGLSISRVTRWRLPKSVQGTGGVVPAHHAIVLLQYAKTHGISVTADDFLTAGAPMADTVEAAE